MLGSWNKNALIGTKVLVRNADGDYIPGIIAAKPVHFMIAAASSRAAGVEFFINFLSSNKLRYFFIIDLLCAEVALY